MNRAPIAVVLLPKQYPLDPDDKYTGFPP